MDRTVNPGGCLQNFTEGSDSKRRSFGLFYVLPGTEPQEGRKLGPEGRGGPLN